MTILTKLSTVLVNFDQFWTEETGQNRFYPVFSILAGRNRFWTAKTQPCQACLWGVPSKKERNGRPMTPTPTINHMNVGLKKVEYGRMVGVFGAI